MPELTLRHAIKNEDGLFENLLKNFINIRTNCSFWFVSQVKIFRMSNPINGRILIRNVTWRCGGTIKLIRCVGNLCGLFFYIITNHISNEFQLQQQLEMINNLCQSLLQDRTSNQSPPSTSNSLPNTIGNVALMPNYNNAFMMPYNFGNQGAGSSSDPAGVPWWAIVQQQQLALQQQQLAAQQQQLIASSWDSNQYIQHMLNQQREISTLKNSINNVKWLNYRIILFRECF